MEKKTSFEDRGNNLSESQIGSRVDGNDSILSDNMKRIFQQFDKQQENITPSLGHFSNSTGELFSKTHPSEEKVNGAVKASIARSKPTFLRPGDRRCLFSGKKKSQRGPLKKRSPKQSSSMPSMYNLYAPVSTPVASQTGSSGYSSLGSISSASSLFRRRLTSSVVKKRGKRLLYQLPVKRNLNNQLMAGPLLSTPKTISSTGGTSLFSNTNCPPINSKHASSSTPIPFLFSKKRKLPNRVVTNVPKINPAVDLFHTPSDTGEIREKEMRSDINNQSCDVKKTVGIPSSSINILRITHPFETYPHVTKMSRYDPISSPLAEVPVARSKNEAHSDCHFHVNKVKTNGVEIGERMLSKPRVTKAQKCALFSPLLRCRNATLYTDANSRSSPLKSCTKEKSSRNTKGQKTKKSNFRKQSLDRPDLFRNVRTTNQPCKCKKSQCLKLYCECFHSARFCDPNLCNCVNCMNNEAHNSSNQPRGRRVLAMLTILAKKPDAFDGGGRKSNTTGCRCKKSRCLNKFCECVASGNRCGEICSCHGCQNC